MAKDPDNLAGDLGAESTGGLFTGLIAEEDEFDRRTLWRLGSWGFAAVGAVTLAVLANQSSLGWHRDQVAAAEVARQAQQIQMLAKESQTETRQLVSAIETLNSDRDRLFSRVTSLEQGLDSVTGTIAKQSAAPQPPPSPVVQPSWLPPAPMVTPVAVAPAVPVTPEKPAAEKPPAMAADKPAVSEKPAEKAQAAVAEASPAVAAASGDTEAPRADSLPRIPSAAAQGIIGPPDPASGKPAEPSAPAPAAAPSPAPEVTATAPAAAATDGGNEKKDDTAAPTTEVQRTEFGVDLGGANSVAGLRALWRGLLKSHANAPLFSLRPIIAIREGTNGLGMQLRLVAGPLRDAGAAARICAVLAENRRACETTIFDGQRLTLKDEPPPAAAGGPVRPAPHRRVAPVPPPKRAAAAPEPEEPPKKPEPTATVSAVSALSTLFGRKEQ